MIIHAVSQQAIRAIEEVRNRYPGEDRCSPEFMDKVQWLITDRRGLPITPFVHHPFQLVLATRGPPEIATRVAGAPVLVDRHAEKFVDDCPGERATMASGHQYIALILSRVREQPRHPQNCSSGGSSCARNGPSATDVINCYGTSSAATTSIPAGRATIRTTLHARTRQLRIHHRARPRRGRHQSARTQTTRSLHRVSSAGIRRG